MMTCEITISVGVSGALFVLLGAMVSTLFTNWTIDANKVLTTCATPLLKELVIDDSELLIKSFQRGTGENRHKISYIPNIKLDWKYLQKDGEHQFDSDSHSEMDDDQHNEFGSEISE